MLYKLRRVPTKAWLLLFGVAVYVGVSAYIRSSSSIDNSTFVYLIQPVVLVLFAIVAHIFIAGRQQKTRHTTEKAVIVASILCIWFVIYFISGLLVTYVHNPLVSDLKSIALNIGAFGVVAASIEYVRYSTMQLAGRRNAIWFGAIVASVFALQQMGVERFVAAGTEEFVKIAVSTYIPAIIASFLLTYLAVAAGLPSMLTYRLGVLAATLLPPIIPKFDWYLVGVSLILLSVAVYIAIDRNALGREATRRYRHHRQIRRSYDIMTVALMISLVLFMTGFFSYKPSVILSNSMKPVFSRGSMVIVEKTIDPMDVKKGDIVQYKAEDHMITHRVVAIDLADDGSGRRVFTTKGDNSPSNDPLVYPKQIVGVIKAQIPLVGYPTLWLNEIGR